MKMECIRSIWDMPDENDKMGTECTTRKQSKEIPELRWEDVVVRHGKLELPSHFWGSIEDLGLCDPLLMGALSSGFDSPYKIQGYAFPYLFRKDSDNIAIHAPNKSGKTVAALLTILHRITSSEWDSFQSIVICPTCHSAEDAFNIVRRLTKFSPKISSFLGIRKVTVKKGRKITERIVIGTPSKILEFMLKDCLALNNVRLLVVDEAEEIVRNQDHQRVVLQIHGMLQRYQMILLSSSPPNLDTDKFLKKITPCCPITLKFPESRGWSNGLQQLFVECNCSKDKEVLLDLITRSNIGQILIFCKTKNEIVDVIEYLKEKGCSAGFLNGKLNVTQREEIKRQFQNRLIEVLVTTTTFDVTSSNLKIEVNYNVLISNCSLDHEEYDKRMSVFHNVQKGIQINVLDCRWAQCATDSKGARLQVLPLQKLQAHLAALVANQNGINR